MASLWLLTKKNLKLLIRAKGSALIVVFAPLLIILILGLAFNTSSASGITVGVHAPSFSEDVNTFITSLEEEDFIVARYESTVEECVSDVKASLVHACLTIPESFSITGNAPKEITFHVDPTRINLVWIIQETVKEKFNLKSQQIAEELTSNILGKLSNTQSRINDERNKISSVKEQNTGAASDSEGVKSSLAVIDLNLAPATYDASVIDGFKQEIEKKVSAGKSELSSVKSSISSSNLNSSEKSSLESDVDDASAELDKITDLLASNTVNGTGAGFEAIRKVMDSLQSDVAVARNKLTSAQEIIAAGVSTLDTLHTNLEQGASSLENLENTLDEISSALGEQPVTEAGTISNPLITNIERISPEGTYLNYSFPALLVLVIMFTSLLLGTTLVMMEKNSPAFTRNFFLPISKVSFVLSTYITNLVLISVQVLIILGISLFFLTDSYTSFPLVGLILFLAASVFTFLGMTIGYVFVSEETGILASISLGSLFLFLSGVVLPLETMPLLFRQITAFNPFVIAEKLIREVFIFQTTLQAIWMNLLILLGYVFVLFLVILIIESLLHEKLRNRFMRHHHKKHKAIQKEKRGA